MNRRIWIGGSVAWIAVVIAGSWLTWFAISNAGSQVSRDPAAAATQSVTIGTVGNAPTAASSGPPRPTRTSSPTLPTASPTRRPSPTSRATPRPTVLPVPVPSRSVGTQSRTWYGTPGSVTAACTGSSAGFRGASPANGWSIEPEDHTGPNVEVKFTKGDGGEVRVQVSCVAGSPRFTVTSTGAPAPEN